MNIPALQSLHVHTEADGRIAVVELNHGRVNEMGSAQIADWEVLAAALPKTDICALITTSTKTTRRGTPIFIAGADVTERAEWTDSQVRTHVRRQRAALATLRAVPVFHIVVVDGLALGWGTEFLITGDYRIAGPQARFALPETGIGILPGAGGTSTLPQLIGVNHALRLGMSGEQIDALEASRIGLVDELATDHEAGMARARALAQMVARRSPTAVSAYKVAVLQALGQSDGERQEIEALAYELCVDSGDAAIGRASFKAITAGESVPWGPRKPLILP
jgi:enoyl-CoA hydratase/carnithine racemase